MLLTNLFIFHRLDGAFGTKRVLKVASGSILHQMLGVLSQQHLTNLAILSVFIFVAPYLRLAVDNSVLLMVLVSTQFSLCYSIITITFGSVSLLVRSTVFFSLHIDSMLDQQCLDTRECCISEWSVCINSISCSSYCPDHWWCVLPPHSLYGVDPDNTHCCAPATFLTFQVHYLPCLRMLRGRSLLTSTSHSRYFACLRSCS